MFETLTYKNSLLRTTPFDMDMTFFSEAERLREEEKAYLTIYTTTQKSKTFYDKKRNSLRVYPAFENIDATSDINVIAQEALSDIFAKWKEKFANHIMKYKKWYKFILTMATMGISMYFTWSTPIISKAFVMGLAKSSVVTYPLNKILKNLSYTGGAPTAIREIVNLSLPKKEEDLDKYKATIDKIVANRFPLEQMEEEEKKEIKPKKDATVNELGYNPNSTNKLVTQTKKAAQDFKNCGFAEKELDRLMNSKEAQTPYGREAVNYAAKNISDIMKKFGESLKESNTTLKQLDGGVRKYAKVKKEDTEKEEA